MSSIAADVKTDMLESADRNNGTAKSAGSGEAFSEALSSTNSGDEAESNTNRTAPYGAVAEREGGGIRITTPDGRSLTKVPATSNRESIKSHFERFDIDPTSYLEAVKDNPAVLAAAEEVLTDRPSNPYIERGAEFVRPVSDFDQETVKDILPGTRSRGSVAGVQQPDRKEALGDQGTQFTYNGLEPFRWAAIAEQEDPLQAARAARSSMRSDPEWQKVSAAYSAIGGYEHTGIYGRHSTDLFDDIV
mgnify:CR=1 FL=1